MNQEIVDHLLVEWELARQRGHAISAEELCGDRPELVGEVNTLIGKLQNTTWMLDDSTAGEESPSSNLEPAAETLPSSIPVAEFVESIIAGELLSATEATQLRQDFPTFQDQSTAEVADQLVADVRLTRYQANVLLKQHDGPLLLDRYVILDSIGSGGMGHVYKAMHRSMDRVVAIKLLPHYAVDSADKIARFQREIKATAQLSHPNIVTAFDAHESNGVYFLVMEYVKGLDLWEQVRKQGPLTVEESVRIILQIADALAEAHRHDIVHRDIKPANILLSHDGEAKLLDLGVARVQTLGRDDAPIHLTQDGMAIGTIAFMSPEQALNSKRADVRSDIYSLGCTLYYLIIARPPFVRDTSIETIVAHREEEIPSLCDERPEIPPSLESAIRHMVAKDPDSRPQTMDEVRELLTGLGLPRSQRLAKNKDVEAVDTSVGFPTVTTITTRKVVRPSRKMHWTMGLGLVAVTTMALVAIMLNNSTGAKNNDREVALWALQAGGTVEVTTQQGEKTLYDSAELTDEKIKLVGIDLLGTTVESIRSVLDLEHLQRLSIADIPINLKVMNKISTMQHLTTLQFNACALRDKHLRVRA